MNAAQILLDILRTHALPDPWEPRSQILGIDMASPNTDQLIGRAGEGDYKIVFPDGTVYEFKGFVQSMYMEFGTDKVDISIRPTGAPTINKAVWIPEFIRADLRHSTASTVYIPGRTMAEVGCMAIELDGFELPEITRTTFDVSSFRDPGPVHLEGITRYGDMKITGKVRK